jgi:clostripain
MNYSPGEILAGNVDLYDLCRRASESEDLGDEVRAQALEVMARVDDFVIASFGMDGYAGFVPGRNGVFIVFPDGDHEIGEGFLAKPLWAESRWYSPLEAEGPEDPYGRWAWCADGAERGNDVVENWFEMLDCWFDDDPHENGGLNDYRW